MKKPMEQLFADKYIELMDITNTDLNRFSFVDTNNQKHNSRTDFYHRDSQTFIEYKCAPLGLHSSNYCEAEQKVWLEKQLSFRLSKHKEIEINQKYGWSNSLHKILMMQRTFNAAGYNFVLVFDDDCDPNRYTAKDFISYLTTGIKQRVKSALSKLVDIEQHKRSDRAYKVSKEHQEILDKHNVKWCFEKDLPLFLSKLGIFSD